MSKTPNAELAKDALNQLMFHSDQGVQYIAHSAYIKT